MTENLEIKLIESIFKQDIAKVKYFADQLDSLDFKTKYRRIEFTPLTCAIEVELDSYDEKYINIIIFLLNAGCDPNFAIDGIYPVSCLSVGVASYLPNDFKLNVLKILVQFGANIESYKMERNRENLISQFIRSTNTCTECIDYLLELGADTTRKSIYPIPERIGPILKHKIEEYSIGRVELLNSIVSHDFKNVINYLQLVKIKNYLMYYNQTDSLPISPLLMAIKRYYELNDSEYRQECFDIIKYLLDNGCDPNYRVGSKLTLSRVLDEFKEDLLIVDLLVLHGANINPIEKIEDTPLIVAIKKKYYSIIDYLMDKGADPNQSTIKTSPVDLMINDITLIKKFPKYRISIKETILKLIKNSNTNMLNVVIIDHEQNINYVLNNTTPLISAIENGNPSMIKLLIEHGADPNLASNTKSPILALINQMYKTGINVELLELIINHPKFDPEQNQILFDDIGRIELPDYRKKYLDSLVNQQAQFRDFVSSVNNIKYGQFETNDPALVEYLNKFNKFKVITVDDINYVIQLLQSIIGSKFNIKRKTSIKDYYKLYPFGIHNGFRMSDLEIMNHIKYWENVKSLLKTPNIGKTLLTKLANDDAEYQLAYGQFFDISHLPSKTLTSDKPKMDQYEIRDIYKIRIPVQEQLWNNRSSPSNTQLLWHGTLSSNLLSILRTGFVIINPIFDQINPKRTGDAFGSGIYFADLAFKSLFYSDNNLRSCAGKKQEDIAYLLLCEVDLGNTFIARRSGDYVDAGTEYHSITATTDKYTSLKYNEYLVKSDCIDRIRPIYLLKVGCRMLV